jgi:hypothetical protein
MRTQKEFIQAVDEMIRQISLSTKHTYEQKVFAVTSLSVMRNDIKAGFSDMRKALKTDYSNDFKEK